MNSTASADLRRAISEVHADGTNPNNHADEIARLSANFPHAIAYEENGLAGRNFNCFMYALGLRKIPNELWEIGTRIQPAHPGTRFVSEMLAAGYLTQVDDAEATDGNLVLYFDNGAVQHAGVLGADGIVVSKWGLGHIWRHPVFEIPSEYGDEARFFVRPDPADVLRRFTDYATKLDDAAKAAAAAKPSPTRAQLGRQSPY